MDPTSVPLEQFEEHRSRLTLIAVRMLGSHAEADDAVQETWLRVSRAADADIASVPAWLTTITARVCLNMLRSRATRREDPFDDVTVDPVTFRSNSNTIIGPENTTLLADEVSLALLIVLETLSPPERLAFVLHDMFALPFDEIAPIVERTPAATRQLASRARRRLHERGADADAGNLGQHRRIVDEFYAAVRVGDLDRVLALLDPNLELHSDGGRTRPEASTVVTGARQIAARAVHFAQPDAILEPVLANGRTAVLVTVGERRVSLMVFAISNERITRIDALVDLERLDRLTVRPF
jgi:RNA polymerase sigma-70 factor (ECF subfamily)